MSVVWLASKRLKRIGIGENKANEFGLGALAIGRARGALRPCELFVSTLRTQTRDFLPSLCLVRMTSPCGFPRRLG
jgi:hypothetical protein